MSTHERPWLNCLLVPVLYAVFLGAFWLIAALFDHQPNAWTVVSGLISAGVLVLLIALIIESFKESARKGWTTLLGIVAFFALMVWATSSRSDSQTGQQTPEIQSK